MASFFKKRYEMSLVVSCILIIMAFAFGFCSVYFVRPGEIDSKIYWFILFQTPTFIGVILYIIRPVVILDTERRMNKAIINVLIKYFKMNKVVYTTLYDQIGRDRAEVRKGEVNAAKTYHWVFSLDAIISAFCSLVSIIVRSIYYGSFSIDSSTYESARASVLWIIVDAVIMLCWTVIAVIVFMGSQEYHDQERDLYYLKAECTVDHYVVWPATNIVVNTELIEAGAEKDYSRKHKRTKK